jgi:hypothetical protein
MRDARDTPLQAEKQYFEVDRIYIRVNDRLRGLVTLLAAGCAETELRREVDAIKPGQAYESLELRELIDQLFLPHGLQIDELSRTTSSKWRLCATVQQRGATGLESALRFRVTVIPEKLANRVARSLKFLFTPLGACLAIVSCITAIFQYSSVRGLESLSLHSLSRSMHGISALSVVIAIAAIIFASIFHEVGHCTAVAAFGSSVRRIGFGIYWFSPALFSDVSAAWTLTRWQRVAVDCGGIYFQALLCGVYAAATLLIDSTSIQLGLRVAIVANIVAIISALNPIMKCDGYWMISDAMSIPNLRRESERAVRDLVRSLMGRRGSQPTAVAGSRRFLIGYGLLSVLFGAMMFVLFTIVVRQNASVAIVLPTDVWNFLHGGPGVGQFGTKLPRLALELLKVVPVVCAPIALFTAVSGLRRFARRTYSKAD